MKQTSALVLAAGWMFTALACCAQAPTKDIGPDKATLKPASPANQAPGPITGPVAGPAGGPQGAAHPLEQPDLEAFFDGILPLQLERSDIAGASVMVMQDGKVLLKKGYGYADIKAKKTVDPDVTIFRLASISKLFTWISIMQLEEQGKLDLDTDINRYLDFQIRPAFNQPITLRNLMTHTGGFEEVLDDILLTDPKKAISLRDDLIQNQPRRLFPPGKIPAYSNYGVGLASYIVQRVSGEPFEQYVREHIFAPLGMSHSSFDQPLKKPLANLPSEGYRSDTIKPPVGFEIFNPVGAGGVSSTAADMGRFGQALLNGGELDGKRILKPETLALMWTPQFRASDQLPALCMGFYQAWRNVAAGSQTVQQQALRDFAQAMANFFARTHRRPTWRKAGRNEGFQIVGHQAQKVRRLSRRVGQVWVPKAGWVRFRWSRQVPAAKSYRVTRDRDHQWHMRSPHRRSRPFRATAKRSELGEVWRSRRRCRPGNLTAPVLLQRRPSGFSAAPPAVQGTARLGAATSLRSRSPAVRAAGDRHRRNFVEQTSTVLARGFDLIVIEDFKVKAMTRSARGTKDEPGGQRRGEGRVEPGHPAAAGWGQLAARSGGQGPGAGGSSGSGVHVAAM